MYSAAFFIVEVYKRVGAHGTDAFQRGLHRDPLGHMLQRSISRGSHLSERLGGESIIGVSVVLVAYCSCYSGYSLVSVFVSDGRRSGNAGRISE